jgi:outer membrane lipoprotein LolB
LGWRLPLDGLRYWVLGVAAPGSAATPQRDADQHLVRLTQQGWRIDYLGYKRVDGTDLPGKIFLQRDEVEVKLVIDAWDAVSR